MIDPLSNKYINWTDGMKISQSHLHQLQGAVEEKFKDANALAMDKDGFGILPFGHDGKKPLDFMLRVEGQSAVQVEIIQARGLTAAGERIEILSTARHGGKESLTGRVELDKASMVNQKAYFVAIAIVAGEMKPFGTPDPNETPPRLPFVEPSLSIQLLPEGTHTDLYRNGLVIGRLTVENAALVADDGYIPPAMAMRSHEALQEFSFKYVQFLQEIEQNAFEIMRNLGRKDTLTALAHSVGEFARAVIEAIQREYDLVEMYGEYMHPARFLLNAKQLARTIKNAIDLMNNEAKEELLLYFQDVIELGPAEYQSVNARVVSARYDHFALRNTLQVILEFCKVNGKLMSELSNLDYIGKKKKTGIFVGEVTKESEAPKPKKRWDF
jgi:hypothetical protein